MSCMNKKLLIISRQPPYGSSLPREALDVALAAAVYDQDISLLFMDDGVFQLVAEQSPEHLQQKNLAAVLSALPLYGIEQIFVHRESLEQRSLTPDDVSLEGVTLLSTADIKALIDQQDHLLSF